jgi:5-hydroxyisourate hydrolase
VPGVSIHVVDVVRGQPATGLRVTLRGLTDAGPRDVASATIGANGQIDHPIVGGMGIDAAEYEVLLHTGEFYRAAGLVGDAPAFQETIAFRFTIGDAREHFHLPFKISPWGLSIWRGR